ncbi:MAG: hypothetical protein JXR68_08385 [Bacteroidales bacterium]|nr:hypothetical protein [Bacteroidales bacterium]
MKNVLTVFFFILIVVFTTNCKNTSSQSDNNSDSSQTVTTNTNTSNSNVVSYDFEELNFSKNEIPDDLYVGDITIGKKWQDKAGINYLVISEKTTTRSQQADMDIKSYEIHGYHFVEKDGEFELIREIKDFQSDCDLILDCGLCENSLELTDINNDNYGEISFLYFLYCAMDASPSTLKLMLLENGEKYAIRGETYVNMGPQTYGGETNVGSEFNNAPAGFKDYAIEKWTKFQYIQSGIVQRADLVKQFEGVKFTGVEPYWTIQFNLFGVLYEEMGENMQFFEYSSIGKRNDGTIDITAKAENTYYDFYIKNETCTDGMSDNEYSYSLEVVKDGQNLYGCCCKK